MPATKTRAPQLSDLTDAMVMCRAVKHSWDDNPVTPIGGATVRRTFTGPYVRSMYFRCSRCGSLRNEVWAIELGRRARLMYRRYVYPEGYRLGRDLMDLELFRGEMLARRGQLVARRATATTAKRHMAQKSGKGSRSRSNARARA